MTGYAEASKVPPEWSGWLHYTFDEPPTTAPLLRRDWEKDHHPQPDRHESTLGAPRARWPVAANVAVATSDYQPWKPE
jgi:NADH:ubiquinone oxidoreductase subunit